MLYDDLKETELNFQYFTLMINKMARIKQSVWEQAAFYDSKANINSSKLPRGKVRSPSLMAGLSI